MKLGGRVTVQQVDAEQVALLLETEGIDLVLTRDALEYEDDGEGGTRPVDPAPTDLLPQRFAFKAVDRSQRLVSSPDADLDLRSEHVLIGREDADVRRNDVFTIDGEDYKVEFVDPDRRGFVNARAVRRSGP